LDVKEILLPLVPNDLKLDIGYIFARDKEEKGKLPFHMKSSERE
jgi:hypothetical protein